MKIVSIVGARPQFIKMAAVSIHLRKYCVEKVINTDQHYDYELSDIFFKELKIPVPDYNLNVGSGTHAYQTAEMLKKIEDALVKEKPDIVVVYGDTNTTLAGALAAAKLNIKIAHVEAGVRVHDKSRPEEINRIVTDHLSDILFPPTENKLKNLYMEGLKEGVHLVGDVMVDVLQKSIDIAERRSRIFEKLNVKMNDYILATVHRPANTDNNERLRNIVNAFLEVDKKIIFPIHPRTLNAVKKYALLDKLHNSDNILLTPPVGYFDMIMLERHAEKIVTDSGGVQREAYILQVPCITLQESTPWNETVEDGWNITVGASKEKIVDAINNFKPSGKTYKNKFGDGHAGEKIAEILCGGKW